MRLKKAILSVMGRDVLKEAVQGLEIFLPLPKFNSERDNPRTVCRKYEQCLFYNQLTIFARLCRR